MAKYNGRDVTVLGPTNPEANDLVKIENLDGRIEDVPASLIEYTDEEFAAKQKDEAKKLEDLKKSREDSKVNKAKETKVEVAKPVEVKPSNKVIR